MDIPALYRHFLAHPVISTDSRDVRPGSLFFALKGPRFNGNRFAAAALENGAALAVVDDPEMAGDERCLLVDDVLTSLQDLARHHRMLSVIPVIGITGTNGKTTTKELVAAVLREHYGRVAASPGNLNNHIGVPLTLLGINRQTEIAVIEMGANQPGEIAMLCGIARPTHGLITSIGLAHLEGFGNIAVITETKKALYDFVKTSGKAVFVNADHDILLRISEGAERITYGRTRRATYRMEDPGHTPEVHLAFRAEGKSWLVRSRLIGAYNFDNLQSAVAVGLAFGVPPEKIVAALEHYEPVNNRSQLIRTARNTVILDAYNANPTSMAASLESFLAFPAADKAVILGDMLELGAHAAEEHHKILSWLEQHPDLKVILTGPVFFSLARRPETLAFPDAASAREYLFQFPFQSHTILIKGSRGIRVEQVLEAL